ncbi:MAG: hypothetical protein GXY14_13160 [Spirochaetes bacterium]|nr:hypothetical protein [Spirochaetota bacterium]
MLELIPSRISNFVDSLAGCVARYSPRLLITLGSPEVNTVVSELPPRSAL